MNCPICYQDYQPGDRLVANKTETFVFKPATVEDVPIFTVDQHGNPREVSAGASLSPDELRELRKDHQKTEVATLFLTYREGELPNNIFNVRHAFCAVQKTAGVGGTHHPLVKHAIRFQRNIRRTHGFAA